MTVMVSGIGGNDDMVQPQAQIKELTNMLFQAGRQRPVALRRKVRAFSAEPGFSVYLWLLFKLQLWQLFRLKL